MFQSLLKYQGAPMTHYDASEANPTPIKAFSSQAKTLRMLGTVRANVKMMWVDPLANVMPGQIISNARGEYYLIVKYELDNVILAPVKTLSALSTLQFSTVLSGNSFTTGGVALNIFSELGAGLVKTPKNVRVLFDLTTTLFDESTAGQLPDGTITLLTATGSGIAMNDEYAWNGFTWRVTQVNPVEADGQIFGLQVLLKQTELQRKQVT